MDVRSVVLKMKNIPAIILALFIFVCGIGGALTGSDLHLDGTYTASDALAAGEHTLFAVSDVADTLLGTTEFIGAHVYDFLYGSGIQVRSVRAQSVVLRLFALFTAFLYLIKSCFGNYTAWRFTQKNAYASSVILLFIHSKDGKK